ncbi:SDR family oxidoreductase [Pseudoroseicyclus tamaricis]|uniref:SDR family oxidoreductase n=1 Tax=Pseudoroseicyclus tamaricis TaxID=2705421 RepID=A0A6B2JPF2_9RHOB|nr:SDR family oxidoreductase [Pseudoroseicyclus tamaricis]NDV00567.1 SDR family oxidoreductase [Pseudoroseicyclus tamaricis]
MDFGIRGKTALVLASSGGLGLGIARALAAEGARVFLTGRTSEKLERAVAAIEADGGEAAWLAADLADPATPGKLEAAVRGALGPVDILVNNTGGPPPGRMSDADLEVIATQFRAMVLSVMAMTAIVVPAMRKTGWGRIITVGSSGVEQPIPKLGISNALRASLAGWSKSMATDLAADGITVNMLLPGRIHTDRVDQIDGGAAERSGKSLEEVREASRATIPAGRYGSVEEFSAVAAFLASAPASYVTGSMVRCDGGLIRST